MRFDKIGKTVTFISGSDFSNSVRVPIRLFSALGMYFIGFTAGGQDINAILDTGAHVSYIHPELARFGDPDGNIVDYNPIYGDIETTKVKLPVTIGSQTQEISMAIMTPNISKQLSMLGFKAILGINEIQWDKMSIDIRNNELVYGQSQK